MPRVFGRFALLIAAAAWGGSCAPTQTAESSQAALPAGRVALAPGGDPSGEDAPAPIHSPSEAQAETTVADAVPSEVREGVLFVDPRVQAGLKQFADEWAQGGSLWMGPLEGNGGRDVVVFVPKGAAPGAEFELVYHFHGTFSEHVEKKRDGVKKRVWVGWDRLEQTMQACEELQGVRGPNIALIYPLSAGKRLEPSHRGWSNVAYDRMWMDPASPPDFRDRFDTMHQEVEELLVDQFGVAPSKLPETVIAEGHSAGGIALLNVARSGTRQVREYLFQDAGFRDWADAVHEELVSHEAEGRVTLVITDKGMTDPFEGRRPWCRDLEEAKNGFVVHAKGCKEDPRRTPAGSELDCEALALAAQEWPDYEAWCEGMKTDMADEPRVYVHRTKVVHAKQPRRFSGGLDLPRDWHRGR